MTLMHLNGTPQPPLTSRTEREAMVALILSAREKERVMLDQEIRQLRELLNAMRARVSQLAGGRS